MRPNNTRTKSTDFPRLDVRVSCFVLHDSDITACENLNKTKASNGWKSCGQPLGRAGRARTVRDGEGGSLHQEEAVSPQSATNRIRWEDRNLRRELNRQQPLQMLLIIWSSLRFSASICASLFCSRVAVRSPLPGERVPFRLSAAPEAAAVPAEFIPGDAAVSLPPVPFVDPELECEVDPDEFAVPKVFVPGDVADFAEFPAPLGSLAELLRPPTFAGPLGMPLIAVVPAPAEPAFGEPAAVPVPAEGPLEAPGPPADDPPPPPPAPPPPPPPPPAPPPP